MKKFFFFALMATAILVGCKNNSKNEPTDPQKEDPKVDTLFTEVYLTIYTSPFVYEYSDIVFYLNDKNGDTIRLAAAERTTPMDTLGVDSAFYANYKGAKLGRESKGDYMLPLDSVKIFQTTEKVKINNVGNTVCRVVAVRNSKNLDFNRDIKYNNLLLAKAIVPVDSKLNQDKDFIGGSMMFAYLHDINLGTDSTTAESRYASSVSAAFGVTGKWSISYYR